MSHGNVTYRICAHSDVYIHMLTMMKELLAPPGNSHGRKAVSLRNYGPTLAYKMQLGNVASQVKSRGHGREW